MTTYYKATFADGRVITRSTASRKYTHAWRGGFNGSEYLARQAAGPGNEVVPAVEITRAEYRALSNPTGNLGR